VAVWRIFARDVANARQYEVRAYTKLDARLTMNAPGAWTLEYPHEAGLASVLDFRGGIVLTRDGETVFSGGEIRHRERRVEYGTFDEWRVGGPDDTGRLARNIVLPHAGPGPYTLAAYATKSGPAENIMRAYVRETVGETAYSTQQQRSINGFSSGVDGGIGRTVEASPRFDTLMEVLQDVAERGGLDDDNPLYFRVLQDSANPSVLNFLVTVPVDRSREVVFARDRKNLLGYVEKEQAPGANYVIVGGKGELEQQVTVEWGETSSINRYGWTEGYLNKTNLDASTDLNDVAVAELIKSRPRSAVEITAIDTDAIQAFRDYGVGDRVTVILDGSARTGIIRELSVSITRADHAVVKPFVVLDGTPL
jgi:hypothetical protein